MAEHLKNEYFYNYNCQFTCFTPYKRHGLNGHCTPQRCGPDVSRKLPGRNERQWRQFYLDRTFR